MAQRSRFNSDGSIISCQMWKDRLFDGDLGALLAGAGEALDALVDHRTHGLQDFNARIPEVLLYGRRNPETREYVIQGFAAEAALVNNALTRGCLTCRETLDHVLSCFGVSPTVQQHHRNSRIEILKAVRAVINERIERLSSTGQQGTKVAVE